MAAYDLPDLPYDYGALAPHISGQIMELHHTKHHATYVKGVNTALEKMEEARASGSFDTIGGLEKNLAFNLGGHINHSVFWPNMSPNGGDQPEHAATRHLEVQPVHRPLGAEGLGQPDEGEGRVHRSSQHRFRTVLSEPGARLSSPQALGCEGSDFLIRLSPR